MATRVIIADDHAVTLGGMSYILNSHGGFEVIATANGGLEAITKTRKLKPDLLVLDFAMPDANGLEVFFETRRWSPDTRTAIVTGTANPEMLRQLVDSGVQGLFMKSSDPNDLADGLARVASGEIVRCKATQAHIDMLAGANNLSTRELEILHAIAQGLSNPKIADRLGISPKTVDSHRTALMRKLDVNSTASLLIRAVRQGLIDI